MKKLIAYIIGGSTILWWVSFLVLPFLNIYPINNILFVTSAATLGFAIILAAVYEYYTNKSLKNFLNFMPDILTYLGLKNKHLQNDDQRSLFYVVLKRFYVACSFITVIILFAARGIFFAPNFEYCLKNNIKNNDVLSKEIGDVYGFGIIRGGEKNGEKGTIKITVRVYGKNGNFPLQAIVNANNSDDPIIKVEILK